MAKIHRSDAPLPQAPSVQVKASYTVTDLTVLFASLSYIPFRRIAFSLVTVTVSSLLIDFIQGNTA